MTSSPLEFEGRSALVTGGASGIGAAVATLLARRGASVLIVDMNAHGAAQLAASLSASGASAHSFTADVARASEAQLAVSHAMELFGRLDVLSNNAGIQRYGTVEETGEAEWEEVMSVNLKSVYNCSRAALPHLVSSGAGAIVNMASVQALASQERVAAYSTSKHALLGLTRSIARDYASKGVRANAVAPGAVETPMLAAAAQLEPDPEGFIAELGRMHPIGRIARPREVAEAVAFLASERASFITGAVLTVDGGLTIALGGAPGEAAH